MVMWYVGAGVSILLVGGWSPGYLVAFVKVVSGCNSGASENTLGEKGNTAFVLISEVCLASGMLCVECCTTLQSASMHAHSSGSLNLDEILC